jgi:molecular chaperone DnaK
LDAILVDVTPHSLGIEVATIAFDRVIPDRYAAIIHRNTTIPTSHTRRFFALSPSQKAVDIKVYQGEEPIASRNTLLGEFLFEGLDPEVPGQNPSVTVQFDLDLNGILNVTVVDRGSHKEQAMTVKAEHSRMNPAEKEAAAAHIAGLDGRPMADDLAALLGRANQLLASRRQGLETLQELVDEAQMAIQEGSVQDQEDLVEELLDALYDLEDEE